MRVAAEHYYVSPLRLHASDFSRPSIGIPPALPLLPFPWSGPPRPTWSSSLNSFMFLQWLYLRAPLLRFDRKPVVFDATLRPSLLAELSYVSRAALLVCLGLSLRLVVVDRDDSLFKSIWALPRVGTKHIYVSSNALPTRLSPLL